MASLMLTGAQRAEFELNGFLVIENALSLEEIKRYTAIVDSIDRRATATFGGKSRSPGDPLELRNAVTFEPELMDVLTHPSAFPAIVDLMGTNICMTTSHVFIRPPTPGAAAAHKQIGWHKDGPPSETTPAMNGRYPWLYTKIGYFLTDLTIPDAGALRVVPGSHRVTQPAWQSGAPDPYGSIELKCKPGTAVIFENRLWHAVGPNYSNAPRKNILHRLLLALDAADRLHPAVERIAAAGDAAAAAVAGRCAERAGVHSAHTAGRAAGGMANADARDQKRRETGSGSEYLSDRFAQQELSRQAKRNRAVETQSCAKLNWRTIAVTARVALRVKDPVAETTSRRRGWPACL